VFSHVFFLPPLPCADWGGPGGRREERCLMVVLLNLALSALAMSQWAHCHLCCHVYVGSLQMSFYSLHRFIDLRNSLPFFLMTPHLLALAGLFLHWGYLILPGFSSGVHFKTTCDWVFYRRSSRDSWQRILFPNSGVTDNS
jgi:hypothetical protein